ncbi:MAG: T9SS type A sorting domain-containing protein [Bacteroidetes bacterium]|nr:T9SS type A sorting domain-containing protein [Bacteroidota bacterium]
MRKSLLLLLAISALKSQAQDTIVTIAYEHDQPTCYFESGSSKFIKISNSPNNLWQIGSPDKTVFKNTYSDNYAIVTDTVYSYPHGNESSFEFVVRSDDATSISFWHKFNTDSLADGGTIEVSADGTNWTNIVNSNLFTFLENFYSSQSVIASNGNKSGFSGNSDWIKSTIHSGALNNIRFRFTFSSDHNSSIKDGWMIDNFEFVCMGTEVKEISVNSPVQFFPNPVSDFLSLNINNSVLFQSANIKDVLGKTIMTTNNTNIDCSSLKGGLYFVEITTDEGRYVGRFLKQ